MKMMNINNIDNIINNIINIGNIEYYSSINSDDINTFKIINININCINNM